MINEARADEYAVLAQDYRSPVGRGVSGVAPRSVVKPDCSTTDDELQLYVGDVLANPSRFVSTLDGALDQSAYRPLARSGFRLGGDRKGGVIGVLETTAGPAYLPARGSRVRGITAMSST